MMTELGNKVTAVHLKRAAYLYVRQWTLRRVVEHTESTKRQYALKQRAVQLGWRPEQITVIDSDLGDPGHRRWIAMASRSWWPKSAWVVPASCSVWRSRGWRATQRTGTGCLKSVRSTTRSSSMKTASIILARSTTACCWA